MQITVTHPPVRVSCRLRVFNYRKPNFGSNEGVIRAKHRFNNYEPDSRRDCNPLSNGYRKSQYMRLRATHPASQNDTLK